MLCLPEVDSHGLSAKPCVGRRTSLPGRIHLHNDQIKREIAQRVIRKPMSKTHMVTPRASAARRHSVVGPAVPPLCMTKPVMKTMIPTIRNNMGASGTVGSEKCRASIIPASAISAAPRIRRSFHRRDNRRDTAAGSSSDDASF